MPSRHVRNISEQEIDVSKNFSRVRHEQCQVTTVIAMATAALIQAIPAEAAAANFLMTTYEADSRLILLDADSGKSTPVGRMGISYVTDLAFGPDGRLYAASVDNLYAVDPATASSRRVGQFGTAQMVGLDFAADQKLYGVGQAGGQLFRIDTSSAAATPLFSTPFTFNGDVAYYRGSTFYATASFAGGSHLVEIDAAKASAVDLGLIFAGQDAPGLDFDAQGRLIAFSPSGHAFSISNFGKSGAGQLLSSFSISVVGATALPVPEPGTGTLLTMGGMALLLAMRKRRSAGLFEP
jgi:outer membrane protein assembly factor BamB